MAKTRPILTNAMSLGVKLLCFCKRLGDCEYIIFESEGVVKSRSMFLGASLHLRVLSTAEKCLTARRSFVTISLKFQ